MKKKVYTAVDVLDARRIVGELKKRGIEGYTKDGGPDDYVELNGISVYGKGIYVEAEDFDEARECLKEIEDINEAGIAGGAPAGTHSSEKQVQRKNNNSTESLNNAGSNKVKKRSKSLEEYDGEYEQGGSGAGKIVAVVLLLVAVAVVAAVLVLR